MPDEKGTEATCPDPPSAHDILFGDAAEKPAPAATEDADADAREHDSNDANGEDEQDTQGSDAAGEPAEAEAQTGTAEELKVVVSIKGDRATIGVKGTSSDPHIESFDALDLSGLAQEVPAVVERARARWEDAPKHPAYERPAPRARRRNRRQQGAAQETAPETQATETEEPQQTLRLF